MQVQANGYSIEVDVQGPPDGAPIVPITGLGMQLTGWPEPFVQTRSAWTTAMRA